MCMGIKAARIDNRLLHGSVATLWASEIKPQRIMVIDDEVAEDPGKKSAMRMAKPVGIALSIITKQTALDNFGIGKYDDHDVYVVTRDPLTILALQEAGQEVPVLCLGGTVTPSEGVPSTQVNRRAYVRDDELSVYRQIAAHGASIEVRYVPADRPEPLSKFVEL